MGDQRLAGFGFSSTVDEVVAGVDLSGRRAVVTGATSGIGVETARALALAGAEVTLAVRRPQAAHEIAAHLMAVTGNRCIEVAHLDLADLGSVDAFATAWVGPLHMLVNNAGIMALPEPEKSPAGWDLQLATNFFGHYALLRGLERPLAEAAGSRVVCVSSAAHLRSPVVFDDLHFRFRPYDPWLAYGQSKTADVLLAVEVGQRWGDRGVQGFALHPGIIRTELQRHITWETDGLPLKSPEQGAATSVLVSSAPELGAGALVYWQDCQPAQVVDARPADYSGGVAAYALDPANASRLWDTAEQLLAPV
ncbi:SDR family NAD(P)-dependent oxidoreductase [Nocardioides endophyticus]|uniref:SDR family NAD(P)-dependent oxidoreductase n=1 Tax=Nocardioides endophyticus TaxID=1353775 RepID=A0ABP8ZDD0_9ACTN